MRLPKDAEAQCQRLLSEFRRNIPADEIYQQRLAEEMEIILSLRFVEYFLRIREILDMTVDLPHMTRGSAGSSLVCWALGITDVDPIEWDIPLSRFLNPHRDDLPDVDIDFPHWAQTQVMQVLATVSALSSKSKRHQKLAQLKLTDAFFQQQSSAKLQTSALECLTTTKFYLLCG